MMAPPKFKVDDDVVWNPALANPFQHLGNGPFKVVQVKTSTTRGNKSVELKIQHPSGAVTTGYIDAKYFVLAK